MLNGFEDILGFKGWNLSCQISNGCMQSSTAQMQVVLYVLLVTRDPCSKDSSHAKNIPEIDKMSNDMELFNSLHYL